jgi:hypothetical protein
MNIFTVELRLHFFAFLSVMPLFVFQMQTLRHENLNDFIGICLVEPHVCILMAYAQKGSLRDLLQNETIYLSADFRYSFAIDIAQVSLVIMPILKFSRRNATYVALYCSR